LSDNAARVPMFGPNNKLFIPGRVVAAKTGTTQEFRDAWTVGYTPSLAVGVWAGNNNNSAMFDGADGSYVAAPIWHDFMAKAIENYPPENFIDYDHNDANELLKDQPKITYYDKNSGDKISQPDTTGMNPGDVQVEVNSPKNDPAPSMIIDFSNFTDPMFARWRAGIGLGNSNQFDFTFNSKSSGHHSKHHKH